MDCHSTPQPHSHQVKQDRRTVLQEKYQFLYPQKPDSNITFCLLKAITDLDTQTCYSQRLQTAHVPDSLHREGMLQDLVFIPALRLTKHPGRAKNAAYSRAGYQKHCGKHSTYTTVHISATRTVHLCFVKLTKCYPRSLMTVSQCQQQLFNTFGFTHHYLFSFPCNQIANGLAEKTGEQRVEWWLLVQEVIQKAQQTLILAQSVADLWHITSQKLTGCVWVSKRAQSKYWM